MISPISSIGSLGFFVSFDMGIALLRRRSPSMESSRHQHRHRADQRTHRPRRLHNVGGFGRGQANIGGVAASHVLVGPPRPGSIGLRRLLDRLADLGARPEDSDDERLRHGTLIFASMVDALISLTLNPLHTFALWLQRQQRDSSLYHDHMVRLVVLARTRPFSHISHHAAPRVLVLLPCFQVFYRFTTSSRDRDCPGISPTSYQPPFACWDANRAPAVLISIARARDSSSQLSDCLRPPPTDLAGDLHGPLAASALQGLLCRSRSWRFSRSSAFGPPILASPRTRRRSRRGL